MTCAWCNDPVDARAGTRFCSTRCRVASHRATPPAELRERARWIRHRAKVPITAWNRPASSTNSATWTCYDEAAASSAGDGLGFVLNGDGVACIDLDHCLDGSTLAPWAQDVLTRAGRTYVEISPSGTGLHIFGYGHVGHGRRIDGLEFYDRGRYICFTGRRFRRSPLVLADISAALVVPMT
jgi:primase-polymerase (primpol)-like protein